MVRRIVVDYVIAHSSGYVFYLICLRYQATLGLGGMAEVRLVYVLSSCHLTSGYVAGKPAIAQFELSNAFQGFYISFWCLYLRRFADCSIVVTVHTIVCLFGAS